MSLEVMSRVWRHRNLQHHPTEKLVLLALADWANDDGICYPSMPSLAAKSSISENAARDIIRALEWFDYLTAERGGGRGKRNHYRLHVEKGRPINRKEVESEARNPPAERGFEDGGLRKTPQQKPPFSSVNPPAETPFLSEVHNVEPSSINHQLEPSEGEEGESHALAPARGEFSTTPSHHPQPNSAISSAILEAVLEATGKTTDWRMGTVSGTFQRSVGRLVGKLERDQRSAEDVRRYRAHLPHFLGRDPTAFTPPSVSQMLDNFDAVLAHWQAAQNMANPNGTHLNDQRFNGSSAAPGPVAPGQPYQRTATGQRGATRERAFSDRQRIRAEYLAEFGPDGEGVEVGGGADEIGGSLPDQ